MIYLYTCGIPVVLILIFLIWRLTSVSRGARQVNERILQRLDPIGEKLSKGEPVQPAEVKEIADTPSTRGMLYDVLKHYERLDLFPEAYLSREAQGQAQLAYWLLHPNELQDDPEAIEYTETIRRELDGEPAEFYIYKYKMKAGHWADKDGWLLGFAGPYFKASIPYEPTGAFSKAGDRFGEARADELVDWFIELTSRRRS